MYLRQIGFLFLLHPSVVSDRSTAILSLECYLQLPLLRVPQVDVALQRGRGQLAAVGPIGYREDVVVVGERLDSALGGEDIPNAARAVPGARDQQLLPGEKGA